MKPVRAWGCLFVVLPFLMTLPCVALAGEDWKPIDPAELKMTTPVVEKDADAEAIFWEVQVDFSSQNKVFVNYVRIKIFTERGKELRSKVELSYSSKNKLEDITGRTIRANGTIVELTREAIFESTLVKLRGIKIITKTFVMPAVEPGAIIEYRWREVRSDSSRYFARLSFQREIPMRLVKYTLKAPSDSFSGFRTKPFNMEDTAMMAENDRRFSYTMTNVRAFHEEPHMPPQDQVRPWLLAYYEPSMVAVGFNINKSLFDDYKSRTKVSDEVKRAAVAAIGDASTPEQKLGRLFEFCRSKIKNVNDDASGLSGVDRAKLKENKSASREIEGE